MEGVSGETPVVRLGANIEVVVAGGAPVVVVLCGGCSIERFRVIEEAEWCVDSVQEVVRLKLAGIR